MTMETPSAERQQCRLVSVPVQSSWQSATGRKEKRDHPWPNPLFPQKPSRIHRYTNKSFELFSLLPTEIRLNIWRFTTFPRAVEIHADKTVNIARSVRLQCSFTHFRTRTQLPATFSVCRESREVVLPRYKLCFSSAIDKDQAPSAIYFNPDVDILYFGLYQDLVSRQAVIEFIQHAFDTFCSHARLDMELVRRIAVSHRALDRVTDFAGLIPHLTRLPSIEEFIVVAEREEIPYKGQFVLRNPEPHDSDIIRLQDWVAVQFRKNQVMKTPAYLEKHIDRVLNVKVMEATFENMYSPPARRLLKPIDKGDNVMKDTAEVVRLQVEVDAHDWFRVVTEMLDCLSFG